MLSTCATIAIMDKKRTASQKLGIFGLWFLFVLVACNLGTTGSAPPPTIVPRASATPPPTLGFNGNAPQTSASGGVQPGDVSTPATNIDVEMYALMQQVDVERLMAHVQTLQDFHTRHVNSTQTSSTRGIGAARTYIQEQFEIVRQQAPFGNFTVQPQPFDMTYNGIPTQQHNIIGVLQGTEPGGGFVVLGAHYDSIGPDFNDATTYAPGANDNGTGVAALIELARIMSQRQYRASVIFVAFSGEEVDRRGSKAFVEWARGRNIDIVGMVNIDSIGNSNNRSGVVDESLRIFSCESESICLDAGASRHMARAVEFLGFAHNAELEMKVERQADRDGRYGDHFSFSEAGYPAIRFISTLEEWPNGSSSDTIQFIERNYFRRTTQSILLIAVALADGPKPPGSITLRDASDGKSTLRWEPVADATGYIVALRWPGSTRYDQQLEWPDTSITWENFKNYAGISIAARGPNGLIGRLSQEYIVQPG